MKNVPGLSHGPLEAACVDAARAAFGADAVAVRPGLIVGPHDPSKPLAAGLTPEREAEILRGA